MDQVEGGREARRNRPLRGPVELSNNKLWAARSQHRARKIGGLIASLLWGWTFVVFFVFAMREVITKGADANALSMLPMTIAGGVFALAWQFYIKPVRWLCPGVGCGKRISANDPWRCGACGHEHVKIRLNGNNSFLDSCDNTDCLCKPEAYECPHCRTINFLTKEQNSLNPARSLNAAPNPVRSDPSDDVRRERARELEEREHKRRHLEADQKQLELEIEVARLRRKLNQPEPTVLTPRQARIKWVAEELDGLRERFTSLDQTESVRRELMAKLHAKDYDAEAKEEMQRVLEMDLERIRLSLGGTHIRM